MFMISANFNTISIQFDEAVQMLINLMKLYGCSGDFSLFGLGTGLWWRSYPAFSSLRSLRFTFIVASCLACSHNQLRQARRHRKSLTIVHILYLSIKATMHLLIFDLQLQGLSSQLSGLQINISRPIFIFMSQTNLQLLRGLRYVDL